MVAANVKMQSGELSNAELHETHGVHVYASVHKAVVMMTAGK